MNTSSRLGVSVLVPMMLMLWGCAPSVRMTVEQRDGAGNLVTSFVKTNSDSGPTKVIVSNSHQIRLTAEAEHKDGLQKLSMAVSGHCGEDGTVQNIGFGFPASGNAIPSNTTPTRFSFSEQISIAGQCDAGSLDLSVTATATSAPTTGILGGGGPATSWTQPAQFVNK
ncbi:MAG TPA: hypothetical protein VFU28_22095 [Vicinamibacterales bacterium]|nr:hypothetical protein [Vicinamibacterales bacterium]